MNNSKKCSAYESGKGCKNGHMVNGGCMGISNINPVCVNEDKLWQEDKNRISLKEWKGQ